MKILIKYPTRSRPEQFLTVVEKMVTMAKEPENIKFLVSFDTDDETMTGAIIQRAAKLHNDITFVAGTSRSKVHAINRDMDISGEWDIVMIASDDMIPRVEHWDDVIRTNFRSYAIGSEGIVLFNEYNLDQALWFFDGYQHRICTLSIMGKDYYNRFNYLYHPDYTSLWCDNEYTDVAVQLGKIKHFPDTILFEHIHPAWGKGLQMDELYRRNEGYFKKDEAVYFKRKSINFGL